MSILDCESYESTLHSLATILSVGSSAIEQFLKTVDLEREFATHQIDCSADTYLYRLLEHRLTLRFTGITEVCWFHLSRVLPGTDFNEGVLPLGIALPRIWDMLGDLLPSPTQKANLESLQRNGVGDFQYNLKASDRFHHGPYAMLVREVAFHAADVGNHDYLGIPEIIEDICNGYRARFGEDITDVVTDSLHECIVKFRSAKYTDEHLLAPALLYCWGVVNQEAFSPFANTCFDGEAVPIPASAILSISKP